MAYRVSLADRAVSDLAGIYGDKNAQTSPPAARWFLGLRDTVLSLKELLYRGSITPENPFLRHLLYGNKPHVYRIIYSIDEEARVVNIAQIRQGDQRPITS